jgi:hypothetical protein
MKNRIWHRTKAQLLAKLRDGFDALPDFYLECRLALD